MVEIRKANEERRNMKRKNQLRLAVRDAEFVRDAAMYLVSKYEDLGSYDPEIGIIIERLSILSEHADRCYKKLRRQENSKRTPVLDRIVQLRLALR